MRGRLWGVVRRFGPAIAVVTGLLMVVVTGSARADWAWDLKNAVWGQSNPMLTPFIQFSDSHGINVWQYELSIDRGNAAMSADKWFWAKIVDPVWQLYRDAVLVGIFLVRWVLDFGWVPPIADASLSVHAALAQVMDQLGLVSLFLTIAGVVGAFYIVKGRLATGLWEMALAVVVVAGLGTFLANPGGLILNRDGGLLYGVRSTSLQFVTAMSDHPAAGTDAQVDAITGDLIETFIRQPLQLVNFGVVLDGGPCEAAYDEVLKSGPHAWGSEIRDKVNSCNSKLGDYAGTPSPPMAMSMLFMYPGAFVVMALAVLIAGAVLKAGVQICYLAVKAAVTTVVGVLPGAARRPLWGTIADLMIACGVFIFSFVWLAVFLQVVRTVLGGSPDMPSTQKILLLDVLLVVGLVLFMINKKRIQESTWRLRELLASRPGGGVGAGSPPPRLNTAAAVSAAAGVANLARSMIKPKKAVSALAGGGPGTGLSGALGGFVGDGFNPPRPSPGPGHGPGPGPNAGPGGGPQLGRGGGRPALGAGPAGRMLVTAGTKLALAHMTGGTSAIAGTALQVISLAKPKPRPELPAGRPSSNPAVRAASGQLPGGSRRPLELTAGPAAAAAAATTSTSSAPGGGRRSSTKPASESRRPVKPRGNQPARPATSADQGTAAGQPPRAPSVDGQHPSRTQPRQQQMPVRRPVRRPQGPRGR